MAETQLTTLSSTSFSFTPLALSALLLTLALLAASRSLSHLNVESWVQAI